MFPTQVSQLVNATVVKSNIESFLLPKRQMSPVKTALTIRDRDRIDFNKYDELFRLHFTCSILKHNDNLFVSSEKIGSTKSV